MAHGGASLASVGRLCLAVNCATLTTSREVENARRGAASRTSYRPYAVSAGLFTCRASRRLSIEPL